MQLAPEKSTLFQIHKYSATLCHALCLNRKEIASSWQRNAITNALVEYG